MSLFDVIGCRAMRSLFDIRRCRYCSLMVVISNMHCVDSREGDESARAEAGRVGAESASLPVTLTQQVCQAERLGAHDILLQLYNRLEENDWLDRFQASSIVYHRMNG